MTDTAQVIGVLIVLALASVGAFGLYTQMRFWLHRRRYRNGRY